jgi:signal transduction histidine kinase
MAASKGLCLSWFVDPSLPPVLLIDSTRLQQILLNLLSNAIKVRNNTFGEAGERLQLVC